MTAVERGTIANILFRHTISRLEALKARYGPLELRHKGRRATLADVCTILADDLKAIGTGASPADMAFVTRLNDTLDRVETRLRAKKQRVSRA
jgi:hypothetical protein